MIITWQKDALCPGGGGGASIKKGGGGSLYLLGVKIQGLVPLRGV